MYYLEFLSSLKVKRISWAASLGTNNKKDLHYMEPILNKKLKNFDYISVRESFLVDYLKRLTTKEVYHVIDPTLMLDKEDYLPLIKQSKKDKHYIYIYTLGNIEAANKTANLISLKTGLPVIANIHDVSQIENLLENSEDDGPSEFLERVFNADYVITDSYHGLIFSLLGKVNVTCFSRKEGLSSRLIDLLDLLDLKNKFFDDNKTHVQEAFSKIDYESIYKKLYRLRKQCDQFLKTSLDLNNS